ncbi:uncharacterized protein [Haliotis asinina]|uniref:uncharacterized protein n=1 Tax=Haliotis asinina TaxID=109174 RepID=UPI0035327F9C
MAGTAHDRSNIANGILSGIVLACGIIFSALAAVIMRRVISLENIPADEGSLNTLATLPVWAVGFAYMVPGLMGLVATFVKAKGMYITHMVFAIITLLAMAIFFIMGIISLAALAELNVDVPQCIPPETDCNIPSSLYSMCVVVIVVIIFGWIFTLVTTILSGILACRDENNTHLVYMQNVPPSMTNVAINSTVSGFSNPNYPTKY